MLRAAAGILGRIVQGLTINGFIAWPLVPQEFRWMLLRVFGIDARRSMIAGRYLIGGRNLSIGAGTYINWGAFIDTSGGVVIGSKCDIGMNVTIVTRTHDIGPADRRAGTPVLGPVSIGDGTWVGANVVVLPGVSIGSGCVIAAGAVVTQDCAADGLYAGVPARRLRDVIETADRART